MAADAAQDSGVLLDPLSLPGSTPGRVWQACQSCRRKKVKCDGKNPCHNCSSRGHTCVFPESKDHASVSRYYASSLEARCQHMDLVCERLERLAKTLSQATDILSRPSSTSHPNGRLGEDVVQAADVLRSFPRSLSGGQLQDSQEEQTGTPATGKVALQNPATPRDLGHDASDYSDEDVDGAQISGNHLDEEDEVEDEEEGDGATQEQAGALVKDSYGRLRFVGGAANEMLIDAAKSLSPLDQVLTPAADTAREVGATSLNADVELPLFIRGRVWPELPFLPKPEQLSRPPQYVSDILVGLYFDRLHYTFPVIFKPHFMDKYSRMLRVGNMPGATHDKEFLMVFFAVCACASSLLPSTSERGFPGIEYYEKALLLHYASPGQASWENVQCLALLAMCAAGWNTLTRSWTLAGQAVRSAMDIGLHLSNRYMKPVGAKPGSSNPSNRLRQQIARRTWWSIFCIERVVSICLGRPMAVQERDCSCELPLDLSDQDLERHCFADDASFTSFASTGITRPLTGFLAFARLCQLSGRIQQLGSPLRLRRRSPHNAEKMTKYLSRVSVIDQALREWHETLPDTIRLSANDPNTATTGGSGPVMCAVISIVHAGSLLNLYRDLIYYLSRFGSGNTSSSAEMVEATAQCITAAKSCINAAELVRSLVPPSHYLAICVHCLTLSGIALLQMSSKPVEPHVIADAEKCVDYLRSLEFRWSGACRSRTIIEHLIVESRRQQQIVPTSGGTMTTAERRPAAATNKRNLVEVDGDDGFQIEDIIWGDGMQWLDFNDTGTALAPFIPWGGV